MNTASIAMEFRRQKQWKAELAEIRAEIKCEMENRVAENDTPVDSILSEMWQRLLRGPLQGFWSGLDQEGTPDCCR